MISFKNLLSVSINGLGLIIRFLLTVFLASSMSSKNYALAMLLIQVVTLTTYVSSLEIHTITSRLLVKSRFSPRVKKLILLIHEKAFFWRYLLGTLILCILLLLVGIDKFEKSTVFIAILVSILDLPLLEQTRIWLIEKRSLLSISFTTTRYSLWALPLLLLIIFKSEVEITSQTIMIAMLLNTFLHYIILFFFSKKDRLKIFKYEQSFELPSLKLFFKARYYFFIASLSILIPQIEKFILSAMNRFDLAAAFTYLLTFSSLPAVFISTYYIAANQGFIVSEAEKVRENWFKSKIFEFVIVSIFLTLGVLLFYHLVQIIIPFENQYTGFLFLFFLTITGIINSFSSLPWLVAYSDYKDKDLLIILTAHLFSNLIFLSLALYLNNVYYLFLSQLPGAIISFCMKFKLSRIKI